MTRPRPPPEDHARIILGVTMLVILAAYATLDRNPSLVLSYGLCLP